jgi:hypothetical protein
VFSIKCALTLNPKPNVLNPGWGRRCRAAACMPHIGREKRAIYRLRTTPRHVGGCGGGGECAAECVATEAARRRRGQHVALNVICRRGMRPEAEDCSRQGCSRARSHHHLGWARHRRTPTPPGTRAWPPRQGVHALAFLLQLSYLTQVFECEHNKYAGLHSDATCSSAAPRRVSHLASASRNCSQRSVAL